MAIFALRVFAILAVLLARPLQVCADDAAPAADVEVTDESAPAPADAPAAESAEGGETAEGTDAEKGQEFVDSAKELQEKLGQLRALLDAKGEGADPALKERLAGLESQLKTLGLDGLGGSSGASPELTEFLGACVAMSLRRAGMQRPATLGALRKLVQNKMTPAEAAQNELWRMVAVCVAEFKEDEFAAFKAGKIKILPKVYVDEAKKPEAEEAVLKTEEATWEQLRTISKGLLEELTAGQDNVSTQGGIGYIAMIPFFGVIGALAYLFMKMQKDKEDKASKKASKKSK